MSPERRKHLHRALEVVTAELVKHGRGELRDSPRGESQLLLAAARLLLWMEKYGVLDEDVAWHKGRHWGFAQIRNEWHPPPALIYGGATAGKGHVELWAYDRRCDE